MDELPKFIDSEEREILLEVTSSDTIMAYHNGIKIGEFSYKRTVIQEKYKEEEYLYTLDIANISSDYQRAGIGTKIIEAGEAYFENVHYPQEHLSEEGASFLTRCAGKNIIKPHQCGPVDGDDPEF